MPRRKHSDGHAPTVAHVLVEALPYIRRFAGRTVVVKYGGNTLAGTSDHDALTLFAEDIVLMHLVGIRPVVVHGGGPQISALMTRLGKTTEFRGGLRVTDAETVDIARMVLIGQVNPQLVTAINLHGDYAVGVSGEDAGLIRATAHDPDLGFVGDVEAINPGILQGLMADEYVPVVATIGTDERGQPYNINADVVAGAIAEALGAEKLVYLTDVEGLRRDRDDPASVDPPDDGERARGTRRRRDHRRRHDPQGPQLPPCSAPRCGTGPHPRRPDRPCPAARDLHGRRHRHDGAGRRGRTMTENCVPDHRGVADDARVRPAVGDVRARAAAPSCGTPTASAISTSCAASP